ncbi:LysM peptidoglycan-binding domain-containing protein [Sporosarcina aquimarina]|uniref:LysM peptidoglycan-binding domain-containing protein n=1 Tax=Sporosarcina aquimarina TaxID=114975 RepID=UPI001C8E8A98|nr:LysM peptidoglycan-binding domain-containing protein [Sporosarcina aquimarina]MBY0222682.1 LysM peptidoglycan-binding domain-containing protein [Sporosarcina aquimarina]
MKKDDYELDFEQNRKEITIEKESDKLPSRSEIHRKKKKENQNRTKLINILLAIFTLIPIVILVYVLSDLYSPAVPNQVPVEKSKVSVSNNSVADGNLTGVAKGNKEQPAETKKPNADAAKKPAVEVKPEKPVEKHKQPAKQPEPKPEAKPKPKPKPEAKPKPVEKPAPKPVEKPVEKPAQNKPATGVRHHVVKPNETLYRISVNYYGSGAHVQKIQQANGLSSNNISVGQTLVLP